MALFWFLFFSSIFRISGIQFKEQAIQSYSDINLYKQLHAAYINKNSVSVFLFGNNKNIQLIQASYPFLETVTQHIHFPNSISLDVTFSAPKFAFRIQNSHVFLHQQNTVFETATQDELVNHAVIIDLPSYINSGASLAGVFAHLSQEKFENALEMIQDVIGSGEISQWNYIPGGSLLQITDKNNKKILFHLEKDMNQQLVKRLDLKNHVPDFDQYRSIDLGSMEFVVVRK